ncbi:hypothetical protein FJV41_27260 [Myxococcus llanfairpwllgwyngyllgogerychwyrndrobwllllantysiliogogogochensis]|uniref:TonB C-terminal domain-containing protein n=2 Tax=Myxococcus llanfairpwllgwyngyllgogerychwyrndrobwllllantysiliogogogochensis TaxID=2590453 RepID=A0A540WUU4_9BACT|nr:hypothetical protein FJV41_27260 [Myxococcus llanfairpwllgwyngyllgogerychwyrndrobwllllantysiliogogogochensis]
MSAATERARQSTPHASTTPLADTAATAERAQESEPSSPRTDTSPADFARENERSSPRTDTSAAAQQAPEREPRVPSDALADTSPPIDLAREHAPRGSVSDLPRANPLLANDVPRAAPSSSALTDFALAPESMARTADSTRLSEPSGSRLLLAARTQAAPMRLSDTTSAPDVGIRDARKSPTPQALVEDLVSESVGRGKVDRGLVHPYFSQLGKKLVALWDADRSVKEHGLQGYFDMGMERSRAYGRAWSERAANYGSSGAFVANNQPVDDKRRPTSTVGDPALRMRSELREKMREGFRSTRRALIRVVQDRQGRLLDVLLVEPSHQPQVDQEAVKDVRSAAEKLPPPPAEAVGSRERIVSLWEFELIISISPPIPTFTFEFDEALGFIDTRLPLDKRIYKRVRLVELR